MRVIYILVMVALVLVALGALRTADYSEAGAGVFLLAVLLLGGMVGALILGRIPAGKFSDLWPVRMMRLWAEGTERKLTERAGKEPPAGEPRD